MRGRRARLFGIFLAAASVWLVGWRAPAAQENLILCVSPGVIEAARASGAGRFQIVWSVIVPEALGPLILGYTFAVVSLVDMSAVAGFIGGGGLGDFAIQYGYRQFQPEVTWAAVIVIVILVQGLQFLGNFLARKTLRR